MSAMVERVARAICEAERMNPDDKLGGWVHWQDAARAAIEAMKDPTEDMIMAARQEANVNGMGPRGMIHCFRTAIDAALTPPRSRNAERGR